MYLDQVRKSVAETPEWLQAVVTALWGAVPYVEGEIAAVLAVVVGVPVVVAIVAAIIGNVVGVVALVYLTDKIRAYFRRNKKDTTHSPRMEKVRRAMHKYGVPGAAVLGPFITGTYGTAFLLIVAGADKRRVLFWTIIGIVSFTIVFALLARFGLFVLSDMR